MLASNKHSSLLLIAAASLKITLRLRHILGVELKLLMTHLQSFLKIRVT